VLITVEQEAANMATMSPTVEGATRTENTNIIENEQINNAQLAVESAAEALRTEASEDDVLHDLRDSFARTASLSKRPALRRKNSGGGRPMAPRRAQSLHAGQVRSVGVTKSGDLSSMPTLLQQGNPRSVLQRPPVPPRTNSSSKNFNRAKPARTASDSLRTMRRDQLVNTVLERKESTHSLLRGPDDKSVASFSDLDSCFTMDSVTMRKHQLIADPLDDGTYHENDSFADHDDSVSHFSEYPAELRELARYESGETLSHVGGESIATFCTLDSLRLRRLQIHDGVDQACDISFFSNSLSTLNTADLDLDISIMDEEEGLCGLDDLDELGESKLCDLGDSGSSNASVAASVASAACVSIEANEANEANVD
jgi:hypothetical protein